MGVGPDRSDCAGAPGDRWQRGAGGSVMTCSLLIAGHDPALHSDPHRFDIERADTTHLAIGGSMHYCLGAPLAAPRHRSRARLRASAKRRPNIFLESYLQGLLGAKQLNFTI